MICIVIPAEPVAQGRVKAFYNKHTGRAGVYDPSKSRNYKATAQQHFRDAWRATPLLGPIRMEIISFFMLAKSHHRKTNPRPRQWHTTKPDGSNIQKIIEDAGNGILWMDDAQIADYRGRKILAAQGEEPRVEVWFEPLDPLVPGEPLKAASAQGALEFPR